MGGGSAKESTAEIKVGARGALFRVGSGVGSGQAEREAEDEEAEAAVAVLLLRGVAFSCAEAIVKG